MTYSNNSLSTLMIQNYLENDVNHKLITISESPIDECRRVEDEGQIQEKKEALVERLKCLQHQMCDLKRQLAEEKVLWKKEVDLAMYLTAPHAGAVENSEMSNNPICSTLGSDHSFESGLQYNEISTIDYEVILGKYQDTILRKQTENREKIKRQIAIENYKRRLLEVENMCNLELLRVKQNVQYLQPLQVMICEWKSEHKENMNCDEEIMGIKKGSTSVTSINEQNHGFETKSSDISKGLFSQNQSNNKICNVINEMLPKFHLCNDTNTVWYTAENTFEADHMRSSERYSTEQLPSDDN